MTLSNRMKQRHIQDRKERSKTKTCTKCGLDKDKSHFSSRNSRCNTCIANNYVTCGCGDPKHRRLLERDMQIYDVANDMYFLSQECADEAWGIDRE